MAEKSELQNIEYRISNVEGWNRSRNAGACAACRSDFFKIKNHAVDSVFSF
jgi:hypothetical protein